MVKQQAQGGTTNKRQSKDWNGAKKGKGMPGGKSNQDEGKGAAVETIHQICLRGLADDVPDAAIEEFLAKQAAPTRIRRVPKSTIAYAEFSTPAAARKVLQLHNKTCAGVAVSVSVPPGGTKLMRPARGMSWQDVKEAARKAFPVSAPAAKAGNSSSDASVGVSAGPCRVLIENMPKGCNSEAVRATFGGCGGISNVDIRRNGRRAFVTFDSHDAALNAVKRTGSFVIGDKRPRVAWVKGEAPNPSASKKSKEEPKPADHDVVAIQAIPHTVHITGLPKETTAEQIKEGLQSSGGDVIDVRMLGDQAFADLSTKTAAKKACKAGLSLSNSSKKCSVHMSRSTNKKRILQAASGELMTPTSANGSSSTSKAAPSAPCKTIFVKNLPYDMDETAIKKLFAACGGVGGVRTFNDADTGSFKGMAYVEFNEQGRPAETAVKMNGKEVEGRKIVVDFAEDKSQVLARRKRAREAAENKEKGKGGWKQSKKPSGGKDKENQGKKGSSRPAPFKKKQRQD